ncbi:hypothetical protein TNIN_489821 [Trichonephila inaurata madagascariensis]|uniref:Uncharacterized protein n=1 Tax=Trichonephila inaurata madagascariensis TaxID=2747483 RepID=A0A8X6WTY4_9ARAC|nr:hypothetical protein TNIN_489821 [Trichonephila inaurata madagascariensis]
MEGRGSNNIQMEVVKSSIWNLKMTKFTICMPLNFNSLTGNAAMGSTLDIFVQGSPYDLRDYLAVARIPGCERLCTAERRFVGEHEDVKAYCTREISQYISVVVPGIRNCLS